MFPGCVETDLVSVSPPQLLRNIQAAVISNEAAVRPVGIIKTEWALVLRIPRVLDADGGGHHGDDAATACIPLPLLGKVVNEQHLIKDFGLI